MIMGKKIAKFFKQLFCDHRYEKELINGAFIVENGFLVHPFHYRCKKCGKVIKGN